MRDAGYPLAIKEEESKIVEDDEAGRGGDEAEGGVEGVKERLKCRR